MISRHDIVILDIDSNSTLAFVAISLRALLASHMTLSATVLPEDMRKEKSDGYLEALHTKDLPDCGHIGRQSAPTHGVTESRKSILIVLGPHVPLLRPDSNISFENNAITGV